MKSTQDYLDDNYFERLKNIVLKLTKIDVSIKHEKKTQNIVNARLTFIGILDKKLLLNPEHNKEVAFYIHIHRTTVLRHLKNIRNKYSVESTVFRNIELGSKKIKGISNKKYSEYKNNILLKIKALEKKIEDYKTLYDKY